MAQNPHEHEKYWKFVFSPCEYMARDQPKSMMAQHMQKSSAMKIGAHTTKIVKSFTSSSCDKSEAEYNQLCTEAKNYYYYKTGGLF